MSKRTYVLSGTLNRTVHTTWSAIIFDRRKRKVKTSRDQQAASTVSRPLMKHFISADLARCRRVSPEYFFIVTSAPAHNSRRTVAILSASTASCIGLHAYASTHVLNQSVASSDISSVWVVVTPMIWLLFDCNFLFTSVIYSTSIQLLNRSHDHRFTLRYLNKSRTLTAVIKSSFKTCVISDASHTAYHC